MTINIGRNPYAQPCVAPQIRPDVLSASESAVALAVMALTQRHKRSRVFALANETSSQSSEA